MNTDSPYAVFISGGKQHRAQVGQKLRLEKIPNCPESIVFDKVILVAKGDEVTIGAPYVREGKVQAKLCSHGRHKKIIVTKFKRRTKYRRTIGHRQDYTEVEITDIIAA